MALSDLLGRSTHEVDRSRLEALCDTVDRGLRSFVDAGDALMEIRDQQLFREDAGTFEAFCRDRWGMTPQHANRLISAANICRNLEPTGSVPQTERQARELGSLPEEVQVEAWEEARESADVDGVVPASAVREAVAKRKKSKAKKKIRPVRLRVPGATVVVEQNSKSQGLIACLESALRMAKERELKKAA